MGRPSRPIDPEAGSIQAFAEELRSLRALAGSPTYQTMANRSGRSKEALADAARGVRMVSWETVDAYVVACGGDPAEWKAKYLKAHPERVTSTPPADGPEHPLDEAAPREPAPREQDLREQDLREQDLREQDLREQGLPVNGVGAETAESRRSNWPMPRRWVRGSVIAGAIAALAIAGIHGLLSSSSEPEGALMAPADEVSSAAFAFQEHECDHWWPLPGQPNVGWHYRACIHRDARTPSTWRAGAQVRNLGTTPDHVEVYVSWASVPAAGGANAAVGHLSMQTGMVPAREVRQVVGPPFEHPGADLCTWSEVRPLVTPEQKWSDSPRFDVKGDECRFE